MLRTKEHNKKIADGNIKHGMRFTRFYTIWRNMKARCYNPKASGYKNYGDRGIHVVNKWHKFEGFFNDMYGSYREACNDFGEVNVTIERRNNELDYFDKNCCWIKKAEQAKHTRRNRKITFNGETKNLQDWVSSTGLSRGSLVYRLNNWTLEKTLTTK